MNKKKTILAAVVLMLVLLIGGVVAYFTSTDDAVNEFTLGNIRIELEEGDWDPAAAQNVMPGQKIVKEPSVHNVSDENDAYVFLKVESPCTTETTPTEIFQYTTNSGWLEITDPAAACTNGNITRLYAWGNGTAMTKVAADAYTETLFDEVRVDRTLQGEEEGLNPTGGLKITVKAYGVQADGLLDQDDNEVKAPIAVWGLANFTD